MQTHELKTLPDFFDAIKRGEKTFEVRENDRGYQTGDRLLLKRFAPGQSMIGGETIKATVTYVLSGWGLKNGYVAMGLNIEN